MKLVNYIKAYAFHNINSAVKIAEETKSKSDIHFARKILHIKSSPKKTSNYEYDKLQHWHKRLNSLSRINLFPNNSHPVDYYKTVHIEKFISSDEKLMLIKIGYVNNFMKSGTPGLTAHGSSKGEIYHFNGLENKIHDKTLRGQYIQVSEHIDTLIEKHSLNELVTNKDPIHFICCFSGQAENEQKQSMAQQLANKLERPVFSYGGHETIYGIKQPNGLKDILDDIGYIGIAKNGMCIKVRPKAVMPNSNITAI